MNKLTIRTQNHSNTTTVENHFIDSFMPRANGEFVKIYLYLIRIMNDPNSSSSLSTIADVLEHTEKDLLRGLSYWEKEGLLSISWDNNHNISAIDIVPSSKAVPQEVVQEVPVTVTEPILAPVIPMVSETPNPAITSVLPTLTNFSATCPTTLNAVKAVASHAETAQNVSINSDEDFEQLLYIIEQYMGSTLSMTVLEHIRYFYDDLKFSSALIEHLFEYCVENNHKSIQYINSVADNWHKEGIKTVEAAKIQSKRYNKSYYIILRSFGISGREPVMHEIQYMDKWLTHWGFSLEMINEACAKTISAIQKPNFNYADAIITNWKDNQVKTLNDILEVDSKHTSTIVKPNNSGNFARGNNRATTNNFTQHEYDMNDIQKLLNAQ